MLLINSFQIFTLQGNYFELVKLPAVITKPTNRPVSVCNNFERFFAIFCHGFLFHIISMDLYFQDRLIACESRFK